MKKLIGIIGISVAILIFIIPILGNKFEQSWYKPAGSGEKIFNHPFSSYTIQIPNDWKASWTLAAKKFAIHDQNNNYIDINVYSNKTNESIQDFVDKNIDPGFPNKHPEFVSATKSLTINGYDAIMIERFQGSYGPAGPLYFISHEGEVIGLSATGFPQGKLEMVDKIVKSVTFK